MLMPYDIATWGITLPEYNMLVEAIEQNIISERQIEKDRLLFVWGVYTARKYIEEKNHLALPHRQFYTDIKPIRSHISQDEFEKICADVIAQYQTIKKHYCESGILHIYYPSNSGKSQNGATLNFNDRGFITGQLMSNSGDRNIAVIVAERITNKIISARYIKSINNKQEETTT